MTRKRSNLIETIPDCMWVHIISFLEYSSSIFFWFRSICQYTKHLSLDFICKMTIKSEHWEFWSQYIQFITHIECSYFKISTISNDVFASCSRLQTLSLVVFDKIGPINIDSQSLKTLKITFYFPLLNENIDKKCALQLNTPNVTDLIIQNGFNLEINGTIGKSLRKLHLCYGYNITWNFKFPNLEELLISGTSLLSYYQLCNLDYITNLSYLKKLFLISIHFQCSICPLLKMFHLTHLSLHDSCWSTTECNFANLTNLEKLNLSRTKINNLSSLSNLTKLCKLKLSYCENISDISPIFHCSSLIDICLQAANVPYCEKKALDLHIAKKKIKK